jgi:hypothetical protein
MRCWTAGVGYDGPSGFSRLPRLITDRVKEDSMSLSARSKTSSRAVLLCRVVGFCVYVGAFFLPACRQVATPGTGVPDVYRGAFCAWVTLVNSLSPEIWHSKDFLAILSGWINPLIALYLIFLVAPKLVWPRRIAASLIALFIAGTWVYFYLVPLVPLVGHVLWIAGILLLLAGEVCGSAKAGSAKASSAAV